MFVVLMRMGKLDSAVHAAKINKLDSAAHAAKIRGPTD